MDRPVLVTYAPVPELGWEVILRRASRCGSELYRILRLAGCASQPLRFLIAVHGYPDDFWRFTASGLREVFSPFHCVSVNKWR
jgi:hypothetical protein